MDIHQAKPEEAMSAELREGRELLVRALIYSYFLDLKGEDRKHAMDIMEVQWQRGKEDPVEAWSEAFDHFVIRSKEKAGKKSVAIEIRDRLIPKWRLPGESDNAFDARLKRRRKKLRQGFQSYWKFCPPPQGITPR